MFGLNTKKKDVKPELSVDLHSHLLPGIDDGVNSFDEAIEILTRFQLWGYQKVITTPHIMQDMYPNSPEIIHAKAKGLRKIIDEKGLQIQFEAAAEYYLDEYLFQMIDNKEDLLLINQEYLLFETSFMNEPVNLKEFIFKANSNGIKPIMAHPERYLYFHNNLNFANEIFDMGAYFQLNINSLGGFYSKPVKKFAEKLINQEMVHFLSSDCHTIAHLDFAEKVFKTKLFAKVKSLNLLNQSLI